MTRRVLVLSLLGLALAATPARVHGQGNRETVLALLQHVAVLEPPAEYRTWWDSLVARCDCTPATMFAEIVWLVAPGRSFRCDADEGGRCRGQWIGETEQIIVAQSYQRQENVVKHEMLHAILGTADHGPTFWRLRLMW